MAQSQAYYLSLDGGPDDLHRTNQELIVNCCGLSVLSQSFQSHQQNGRSDYYLQYMVGGEMDIWLDDQQQLMVPGQAILYYPKTTYRYAMHGTETVTYYWIHFTGSLAEQLVTSSHLPNAQLLPIGSDNALCRQFEELFQLFILREDSFYFLTAARLATLLVNIGRKAVSAATRVNQANLPIVRSLSYIHSHYNQGLSVPYLAQLEHLSVSHYRALFKETTGLSPLNYITTLRINQGRQLLTQTTLSVSEIGATIGYQDSLYFSRLFKQWTGHSPTEYRDPFR